MDIVKLPDPQGMISRIRSNLPRNCSVKKSPFCDHIIGMRLQGISYHQIEDFLKKQGKEFRIPSTTVWRNLEATKLQVELPYAEELKERWGGKFDLDVAKELANQILVQRKRVDQMVRHEQERKINNPGFYNKAIRAEMETLTNTLRCLKDMMKSPDEAVRERVAADGMAKALDPSFEVDKDTADLLQEMILSGEFKINGDQKPS